MPASAIAAKPASALAGAVDVEAVASCLLDSYLAQAVVLQVRHLTAASRSGQQP